MEYEPGLASLTVRVVGSGLGGQVEVRVVHGTEDLHNTVANALKVAGDTEGNIRSPGFWSIVLENNFVEENARNNVSDLGIICKSYTDKLLF